MIWSLSGSFLVLEPLVDTSKNLAVPSVMAMDVLVKYSKCCIFAKTSLNAIFQDFT